ncbi:MAG: DUF1851 domain-containing protein [Pirellulaceae bacterium]|nr:DUF1851 domain-containing protein [Pirellulaceae bacterium]
MNDLTISTNGVDLEAILSDWTWAMSEPLRPVLLTAMGDVFAQGESQAVYFIDIVEGKIHRVAEDGESFRLYLRQNQFVSDHMYPDRVVEFRSEGMTLRPGEVYSHKQLLVIGGDDDIGNIEATDVSVHISIHGQVRRQIKDLPDGVPVSGIKIE